MPWRLITPMSEKKEFISLAVRQDANISRLCRYFQISRKTAYKWLGRYHREGEAGLASRSRRPRSSPGTTPLAMEEAVLRLRQEHPAWGGRKIRARLQHLGWEECRRPAPSAASCGATGSSTRRSRPSIGLGGALKPRRPMTCGRWILRDILPPTRGAAIP